MFFCTNLVHFLDDGISGVTMNRPGFVEMMQQLEQGKASAVFVKDLSRLWCCTIKVDIENSKSQYIEKDKQEETKDGSESTKI